MKENQALKVISYIFLPIIILIFLFSTVTCVLLLSYNYTSKKEYFKSNEFYSRVEASFTDIADKLIFAREKNYNVFYEDNYKIFKSVNLPVNLNELENLKYLAIYENKVLTNLDVENENLEMLISKIQGRFEDSNYVQYTNNEITAKSKELEEFLKSDIGFIRNYTIDYYTIENTTDNARIEKYSDDEGYVVLEIQADEGELVSKTLDLGEFKEEEIKEEKIYKTAKLEEFNIYITYDENFIPESNMNLLLDSLEIVKPYKTAICITVPISLIIMVILIIYLINSIGYKKGEEGIVLNDFDRIPFEVILTIFCICLGICMAIGGMLIIGNGNQNIETILLLGIIFYAINITIFEIMAVTFIKRIKAKSFLSTCLIGRLFYFFAKLIKKFFNKVKNFVRNLINGILNKLKKIIVKFKYNTNLTVKYFSIVTICLIIMFLMGIYLGPVGIIIDIVIVELLVCWFFFKIQSFKKFEDSLKKVSEGTLEGKIDDRDYSVEFKNSVEYLNNISNGFEAAVEESMKSERMKTELITNVSHDIKTPLTSIINYVDLLKKEEIDNEKAKEYLDILDAKSQRLKRLTEDLVEASKASSGNLKLDLKQINIVELINQALGEFEDKFKEKKLEVISNFEKPTINIKADSRYMYRVIENLFSNISKYALDGSRVYIDVKKVNSSMIIQLKNISKDRLNITEEELMQRFVRRDKSRTTEGSGLGLAIARSLVLLQGGKLECKIDGDLFKIEITMKWI